jgi:murein DD-endopeptidase MepM/ murein hydrolase activator NlpD
MSNDYPINKLTFKANTFFKANKKDRFNLLLNRIYDTSEMAFDQNRTEFTAIILDGFENNQITATTSEESKDKAKTATSTVPKIVKDKATGKDYVELKVRFVGDNTGETAGLKDPRSFLSTDMAEVATRVKLHPTALMPVDLYFKNPISFNSLVNVKKTDGIFYITEVSPTIARLQQIQTDPALAAYRWGTGNFGPAAFSTQGGIIIPNTPANAKKVPGTVFPTKPERTVTSLVGVRPRPNTQKDRDRGTVGDPSWHNGIDLGTPMNDPIYSIADGKVVYCTPVGQPNSGAGNYCIIEHTGLKRVDGTDFKCYTKYMHNTSMLVKKDDIVKRGQQIAFAGTTGASTGPHLHFEARSAKDGGKTYDPLWLFGWHDAGMVIRGAGDKTKWTQRALTAAKNDGRLPYSLGKTKKKKNKKTTSSQNQSSITQTETNQSTQVKSPVGFSIENYTKNPAVSDLFKVSGK